MQKLGVTAPYPIRVILTLIIYASNIFFVVFLLFFPRDVMSAARNGLILWFNNVLPALLPFIVTVNLLNALGFVRYISRWAEPFMAVVFKLPGAGGFALITGLLSGYPMGAKTVSDLRRAGEITTKEAQRLLAFCNNAGPLFIVGVVGVGLIGDSSAGYVLWAGHVAAALTIGVLTRWWGQAAGPCSRSSGKPKDNNTQLVHMSDIPNIGKVMGEAVKNAMEALLVVGGLIIFFSVVVRCVTILTGDMPFMTEGMLTGIFEITSGVRVLADTSYGVISPARLAAIGGVIGFGGFSVHAQALHFASGTGIKAGAYIFFKALNGIFAAGISWAIWMIFI